MSRPTECHWTDREQRGYRTVLTGMDGALNALREVNTEHTGCSCRLCIGVGHALYTVQLLASMLEGDAPPNVVIDVRQEYRDRLERDLAALAARQAADAPAVVVAFRESI
jgi:hypothetical protein